MVYGYSNEMVMAKLPWSKVVCDVFRCLFYAQHHCAARQALPVRRGNARDELGE